jgi:phosphoglycerate dehydrogenase-like enzyme
MTQGRTPRILVCDPIHEDGLELLRARATVDVAENAFTEEQLRSAIGGYEAVITRSRTQIPASVIVEGQRLRVIGRAGAGLDNIDVHAAQAHGVEVVNAPGANTLAVAEHTFALLLGLARQIPQADRSLKEGRWEKSALMGVGLVGKTLGIIGFGQIGRQVARRAAAFDMKIMVNQPRLTPELALELGVEQAELPVLLQKADFVSLHVPMRPSNIGLIGRTELAQMKPSAYLLNTARGGIIDEEALLTALNEAWIAGAGLDVFQGEPHVRPELVKHPRVLATPHIAASTEDAQRKAAVTIAEQVLAVLERQGTSETLNLRIVPVHHVAPHEAYDPKRVALLADRLEADGLLVNPPVVAKRGDLYVVLDGATRVTAFRQLGYPHIVVQVVDLDAGGVTLHTWYHAISGQSCEELYRLFQKTPGLLLEQVEPVQGRDALRLPDALAILHLADKRRFVLKMKQDEGHGDWLDTLNRMVAAYTEWGTVARTLSTDLDALQAQYADLCGLVIFPQFTPERVLSVAAEGRTMPAGITRFVIPGRVLRLNAPLEKLRSDEPLREKAIWLDHFVQEKLAYRKVRYYQEPVFLLDE